MSAIAAGLLNTRAEGRHFYVWMGVAFVLVAFDGFLPTYWAPVMAGSFKAPPVIHIHGALMFVWTLFFLVQTMLVAAGRTIDHRAWGMAGIALFSVIACAVLVGEMAVLKRDEAAGMGDASRRFAAVTLCAWPLMVGLFTLAIVYVRRSDVHKRLLILLMAAMMTPGHRKSVPDAARTAGRFGRWSAAAVRVDPARADGGPVHRRRDGLRLAHAGTAAQGLCDRVAGCWRSK